MNLKHAEFFVTLVFISLCAFVDVLTCSEEAKASISRSLDLSIPSWRPLVQNPYHHLQHQYYQSNAAPSAAHLISYAHLNPVSKDEIIEAAKHNAQALKKYNELSHQPITSYSNPYPFFTQTPGPLTKVISTTAFLNPNLVRQQQQQQQLQQQPLVAASNHIHARLPYPGKSASLYSTKLNFLGKPELSVSLHHQNGIHHQTVATTPKIAGFTKEQSGRVNFHYHHPSFGMVPIYDTTTKRIPMFSSSVTPQSTTKVHPVMSKLQAHMLAAMSQQSQQNKLKHAHRPNAGSSLSAPSQSSLSSSSGSSSGGSSNEFSPPSQIVSNYANYESATRVPVWHHGSPVKSGSSNHHQHHHHHNHHHASQNSDFHHHQHYPQFHKSESHQQQQQVMPSVHPSIITPFLEQVHLKQKEAAAAEQKQSFKQSHESNSNENNSGSYEVVNDVFSKHLVPPPPSAASSHYKSRPEKTEKHPKFNLSMKSPLQDASRFNYNNVISTATPAPSLPSYATAAAATAASSSTKVPPFRALNEIPKYRPSFSENVHVSTTEKPNLFVNLNRSKENPYKHHKLLHPGYTGGGLKKKPTFNHEKTFLPTPYRPTAEDEKDAEIKIDFEPHHSYFTIEDAVTPHFPDSLKYDSHGGDGGSDELEIITLRPQIRPTKDYASVTPTSTLRSTFVEPTAGDIQIASSQKPRQKLRRRKPKPSTVASTTTTTTTTTTSESFYEKQHTAPQEVSEEQTNVSTKPLRTRGNVRNNNNTAAHESDSRTRNRINNNRVRTRPSLTSPAVTLSTAADYDFTARPYDEELRRSEVATTQVTTEGTTSTKASAESSDQPDVVRHRVRLRYKNKLNAKAAAAAGSTLEGLDFKSKLTDSQISDSENENVLVRQPTGEETTELNIATENPYNEIKSSLKLPSLKLRNEAYTTVATTAETLNSPTSSTATAESDDNHLSPKIANNRPRFSIKELKRKQYLTSSTSVVSSPSSTVLTSSTSSTTQRPDSQRFNRFRLNLNRRRNETSDSNEETDLPRKRYSSTRYSTSSSFSSTTTTTPESSVSTTKRTLLPKRTYPVRNFTRPTAPESNDTTSPRSTVTTKSTVTSNRHNVRQRIQNYKKKDTSNEIAAPPSATSFEESIKNVNFETTLLHEQHQPPTTSTTTTTTVAELPITRETSIMKIAKTPSSVMKVTTGSNNNNFEDTPSSVVNDSTDLIGSPSDYSQRVAELTISGNENSTFKSANIGLLSRRIPNYFTISTDDPILPIQAFFPQIKTNESN